MLLFLLDFASRVGRWQKMEIDLPSIDAQSMPIKWMNHFSHLQHFIYLNRSICNRCFESINVFQTKRYHRLKWNAVKCIVYFYLLVLYFTNHMDYLLRCIMHFDERKQNAFFFLPFILIVGLHFNFNFQFLFNRL